MSEGNKGNGVFWQIAIPVIVALLAGGTSPWWWQELFGKVDPAPQPIPTPAPDPNPDPGPSPEPTPSAQTASINVAYTGDSFACSLPIAIGIGGQSFSPSGNSSTFEVATGQQPYQIQGQINCLGIGNCQVYGEGSIEVIPGNTYYLGWQNVGPGQCSASLR